MAYPLINAALINGEVASEAGTRSLRALRFGIPIAEFDRPAMGFMPVQFGIPSRTVGAPFVADPPPASLLALHFGLARLSLGMPPAGVAYAARPLRGVRFGKPAVNIALLTPTVQGWRCSRFSPGTRLQTVYRALGVSITLFGSIQSVQVLAARSSRVARLGSHVAAHAFLPASVRTVRWSIPKLALSASAFQVEGAVSIKFGSHGPLGFGLRARPLCATKMGRVAMNRGVQC